MRCISLFWRRVAAAHRLGYFLCFLFCINGFLLSIHRLYIQENCLRKDKIQETKSVFASGIRGLLYADEPVEKFLWRREARALADVIPVVEYNSSSKESKDHNHVSYEKSEILQTIDRDNASSSLDGELYAILMEAYSINGNSEEIKQIKNIYEDQFVWNCYDINTLEERVVLPLLNYTSFTNSKKIGKFYFDEGKIHNVTTKQFTKNSVLKEDLLFEKEKRTFFKLLKMQGWPGIPRIYGACMLTMDNIDVVSLNNKAGKIHSLRYIIDRYDDAVPICEERNATDECIKLNKLRRYVKSFRHPAVKALKIMLGFAETFENLWMNGVFPYQFNLNEVVITSKNEVVFTNVESFIFLELSSHSFDSYKRWAYVNDPCIYQFHCYTGRLLSDFMCKDWRQCPIPGWQPHQLLFRLGQHCKEVRGHCSLITARCWGMDTTVYLCTFTKWIFHQLQMLVPSSWNHHKEIDQLFACSYKSLPDTRCDWTGFLHGISNLAQFAEEEFKKKRRS